MSRQPTHKEKTERAYRAYRDLLDAEERLKWALRGPLRLSGLTVEGFRLLELLDREGALPLADIVRRRGRNREATYDVIARLAKHGWVLRIFARLPPVEFKLAHLAKAKKDEPRRGRRFSVLGLTAPGKKFIGEVRKRYSTVMKSIMRGINAREMGSLIRICRKLREGDAVKFLRELRMMEEDQQAAEFRESVEAELERLTGPKRVKLPKALVRALREASRSR